MDAAVIHTKIEILRVQPDGTKSVIASMMHAHPDHSVTYESRVTVTPPKEDEAAS